MKNHIAGHERPNHRVTAKIMRHNVQRYTHPAALQQVQQHSIGSSGVVAYGSAQEHGRHLLCYLPLYVTQRAAVGDCRVCGHPALQARVQLQPRARVSLAPRPTAHRIRPKCFAVRVTKLLAHNAYVASSGSDLPDGVEALVIGHQPVQKRLQHDMYTTPAVAGHSRPVRRVTICVEYEQNNLAAAAVHEFAKLLHNFLHAREQVLQLQPC